MLWSLLDYHNVTATHRITQPNANHANSRNRKRTAFPMHTKLHKKTNNSHNTHPGQEKMEEIQFSRALPCSQTRNE